MAYDVTFPLLRSLELSVVFQLSSADLKNPLEKEATKLKELKEKVEGKAPGKQTL